MTELLRKALAFKQRALGFKRSGKGYTVNGEKRTGLLPALRLYLYAKGTPKFPRLRTGSGSSCRRGRRIEKELAHPSKDPTVRIFQRQLQRRNLEVVAEQLICSKGGIATAADLVCVNKKTLQLEVLEIKTGFGGRTDLDAQYSKRATHIRKGPFEATPIKDCWRNRHLLQAAVTAHMVNECYETKKMHVAKAHVVYTDRRQWVSLFPEWWYNKEDLDSICTLLSPGPITRT